MGCCEVISLSIGISVPCGNDRDLMSHPSYFNSTRPSAPHFRREAPPFFDRLRYSMVRRASARLADPILARAWGLVAPRGGRLRDATLNRADCASRSRNMTSPSPSLQTTPLILLPTSTRARVIAPHIGARSLEWKPRESPRPHARSGAGAEEVTYRAAV